MFDRRTLNNTEKVIVNQSGNLSSKFKIVGNYDGFRMLQAFHFFDLCLVYHLILITRLIPPWKSGTEKVEDIWVLRMKSAKRSRQSTLKAM
jgi:hypothetical protein